MSKQAGDGLNCDPRGIRNQVLDVTKLERRPLEGSISPRPPRFLGEHITDHAMVGLKAQMKSWIMRLARLKKLGGGFPTQRMCQRRERISELTMIALPRADSPRCEWMWMWRCIFVVKGRPLLVGKDDGEAKVYEAFLRMRVHPCGLEVSDQECFQSVVRGPRHGEGLEFGEVDFGVGGALAYQKDISESLRRTRGR
jgi:hypothetical protein